MICSVDGCEKKAMYKADRICQMHYFRRMRNGTFELVRSRKYRVVNPAGYHSIYEPSHDLSQSTGYVFEHRKVLFDAFGHSLERCEICGKPWSWDAIFYSHVDHINEDKSDNRLCNLRPLCNGCNTKRGAPDLYTFHGRIAVTIGEETMTPEEWSRVEGVLVSGKTIRDRIANGMSHYDAVYAPKKTHNGNVPVKPAAPPKHTRKNAVKLTIDGLTMTSAEWSRQDGCTVSDGTIRNRKKAGMSDYDAVFLPRFTAAKATKQSKQSTRQS